MHFNIIDWRPPPLTLLVIIILCVAIGIIIVVIGMSPKVLCWKSS